MTEAVELRVAGSSPCVLPLQQAMEALGIAWTPVDGATGEDATQPLAPQSVVAEGTPFIDGIQAL
eukprot:4082399-Pleurochrysis_carterae.AAC.1